MGAHYPHQPLTRRRLTRLPRLLAGAPLYALALVGLLSLTACSLSLRTTPATVCDKGTNVPIEIRKDIRGSTLALVPVMISGKGPFKLALDTGASLSLVDRSIVTQLSLPIAGPSEPVSGVGGSQEAIPVRINQWATGEVQLPATQVASITLDNTQRSAGIVGLLGSDVLSRFGLVSIDYDGGVLTFYKKIASSVAAPAQPAALRRVVP